MLNVLQVMESNLEDCNAENINNIGNLFVIERSGEAESENYYLNHCYVTLQMLSMHPEVILSYLSQVYLDL